MYDTTGLAVLVFFGGAVVLAELLAKRTGFNAPVLLIVGGVALGFLPITYDEVVQRVQAEVDNEELGLTGAPGPE